MPRLSCRQANFSRLAATLSIQRGCVCTWSRMSWPRCSHTNLARRSLSCCKALCGAPHNALQTDKERLGRLVLDFLGEDIMAQVQESPRWMDNVAAHREKLACRVERQAK